MPALVAMSALGSALTILTAVGLSGIPFTKGLPYRWLLVSSHTLLLAGSLVIAPVYIMLVKGSIYGDVYIPYAFVSGVHIYWPAQYLCSWVGSLLRSEYYSYATSVILIVLMPGLICAVVGGLQWYTVGLLIEYTGRVFRRGQHII